MIKNRKRTSAKGSHFRSFLGNSRGLTLIEVLVTSAIILVLLSGIIGLLVTVNKMNNTSFIRGIAAIYANSLMEEILSYNYQDLSYYNGSDLADATTLYGLHNFSAYAAGTYRDDANSGIWNDTPDPPDTFITALQEVDLGLRRYRSSVWDDTTNPPNAPENASYNSDNPFPLGSNLYFFTNYIGFEDKDIPDIDPGPATTNMQFYIKEGKYPSYYDAPHLYYADDMDDFDGTRISITNVVADTSFIITVAVRPKYGGETGTFSFDDSSGTCSFALAYLEDMGEISPARFKTQFPAMNEPEEMAWEYYKAIYFKEVVVTVKWEYPANSGTYYYYSLYGGKVSPHHKGSL